MGRLQQPAEKMHITSAFKVFLPEVSLALQWNALALLLGAWSTYMNLQISCRTILYRRLWLCLKRYQYGVESVLIICTHHFSFIVCLSFRCWWVHFPRVSNCRFHLEPALYRRLWLCFEAI